nr:hypothetical transcript [Hymenolepis microstoma]
MATSLFCNAGPWAEARDLGPGLNKVPWKQPCIRIQFNLVNLWQFVGKKLQMLWARVLARSVFNGANTSLKKVGLFQSREQLFMKRLSLKVLIVLHPMSSACVKVHSGTRLPVLYLRDSPFRVGRSAMEISENSRGLLE